MGDIIIDLVNQNLLYLRFVSTGNGMIRMDYKISKKVQFAGVAMFRFSHVNLLQLIWINTMIF